MTTHKNNEVSLRTNADGTIASSATYMGSTDPMDIFPDKDPAAHTQSRKELLTRYKGNGDFHYLYEKNKDGKDEVVGDLELNLHSSGYERIAKRISQAHHFMLNEKSVSQDVLKFTLVEAAQKDGVDLSHVKGFENIEKAMHNKVFAKALNAAYGTDHHISEKEASVLAGVAKHPVIDAKDIEQLNNFIAAETKAKGNVR